MKQTNDMITSTVLWVASREMNVGEYRTLEKIIGPFRSFTFNNISTIKYLDFDDISYICAPADDVVIRGSTASEEAYRKFTQDMFAQKLIFQCTGDETVVHGSCIWNVATECTDDGELVYSPVNSMADVYGRMFTMKHNPSKDQNSNSDNTTPKDKNTRTYKVLCLIDANCMVYRDPTEITMMIGELQSTVQASISSNTISWTDLVGYTDDKLKPFDFIMVHDSICDLKIVENIIKRFFALDIPVLAVENSRTHSYIKSVLKTLMND